MFAKERLACSALVALLLGACATAEQNPNSGGPDASAMLPDAAIQFPDARSGTPDSAPGVPDASPGVPDAAPGLPDAAPTPPDAAVPVVVTMTHSASTAITPLNSVSCNNTFGHAANGYYRVFNLAGFGITSDLTVSQVTVGIEEATAGSGGTQPAYVNLFTLNGAFVFANLTLIAQAPVSVANQSATLLNVPISAVIPAGSTLVVEFFTPDGQTDGHFLFVGSNSSGETGPSYLAATDCGFNEPVTTASIGFAGMQIVMSVTGTHLP